MSKRLVDQRWPWILAASLIVIVFLSTFVDVHLGDDDWDSRPTGSVQDIAKLRDRKDLNVLFVLIDTLRAEHLGCYGYQRDTSPVLDRLASTGVRFGRHLSQSSWTKASMASLWTGLYPLHTGITRFDQVLPPQANMPAEILKEAGFQTVGLYRNGWVGPTFGFDQGFDVYQRPVGTAPPASVRRDNPTISEAGTDEPTIAATREFLRLRGHDRWFLYLHLMDLHEYVYDRESALFGVHYKDIYDNSIRWTDGMIDILLSSLADQGYLENTLVIIASDHGEAFGERGFEGHARKVYRETTEIPLLILFPFRLEPGVVIESRTQNIDLWPTVLDLLGLEMPGTDGHSRVPEILAAARGEPLPDPGDPAIAFIDQTWGRPKDPPQPAVSVTEGTLRYAWIDQKPAPVEQLFDSSDDPAEFRNRTAENPEAVKRLSAVAEAYREMKPSWGDVPTRELSELELMHLRALGYAVP